MKKILILLLAICAGCGGPNYTCLFEVWDHELKTQAFTVHNKENPCQTEYVKSGETRMLQTPIIQRNYSNEAVGEMGNSATYRNKKLREDQINECLRKKKLYHWHRNTYCH